MSENNIRNNLITKVLGKNIICFDEIDSTNTYAKKIAAQNAPHGTLVTAKMQNCGRGRLGRSFISPKDCGAYFSLLLRPQSFSDEILLITSAISVAICRAIDNIADVHTQIKWVNDIYLDGKKLCGILAEAASGSDSHSFDYVIVGVGINVANTTFDDEIKNIATSVKAHSQKNVDIDILIASVINEFEKIYDEIESRSFMTEYKERSCVIGKNVNAIKAGETREVFVEDIDENGALVVVNNMGEREHINSGEISIRFN